MLSAGEVTFPTALHAPPVCPSVRVRRRCRNHRPDSSPLQAQCLLGGGEALGPEFGGPQVFTLGPLLSHDSLLTVGITGHSQSSSATSVPLFPICRRGLTSYLPCGVVCRCNEVICVSLLAQCLTQSQYFLLLYLLFILRVA